MLLVGDFTKVQAQEQVEDFFVLTIAKSGTQQLTKCLDRILSSTDLHYKPRHFTPYSRMHFDREKLIINIRDLCDVVISFNNRKFSPEHANKKRWFHMHNEDRINYFIFDDLSIFNVSIQAKRCIETLKFNPHALLIRFENLVGSKGGREDRLQQLEVKKIATGEL